MRTRHTLGQCKAICAASALMLGFITVSAIPVSASAKTNSDPFPATEWAVVTPPSTTSMPVAGTPSAPPPRASFVPQIAQQSGGAEPVLLAQTEHLLQPEPEPQPLKTQNQDYDIATISQWDGLIDRYTTQNAQGIVLFDYAALKASPEDTQELEEYILFMATVSKPSEMPRSEAMTYWANLYNALTVQVVAENYPVKSIRKIKSGFRAGPWKRKLVTVEGKELSLDNIEHDIMRPTFQTPLVHYMVNCASVGCPNLNAEAWQSVGLEDELDMAARAYINSPRGVSIVKGRLQVSSIYKWFEDDFGGNQAGVLAHLRQYANDDLLAKLKGRTKIDKYAYDWDVNAPR